MRSSAHRPRQVLYPAGSPHAFRTFMALVLRDRFESRVVPAGIERVLAEATRLRAATDSTASANQPPSAVPMPAPTPTPNP